MSKYHSIKTCVDGIKFDSKAEARRFVELKALEKKKKIHSLRLQPVFQLIPTFHKGGQTYRRTTYRADFSYFDVEAMKTIVEDVKSPYTAKNAVYRLKKKMFEYLYPDLEIREVMK